MKNIMKSAAFALAAVFAVLSISMSSCSKSGSGSKDDAAATTEAETVVEETADAYGRKGSIEELGPPPIEEATDSDIE